MDSATSRFVMDTPIQPYTAETGPPFMYAIERNPAQQQHILRRLFCGQFMCQSYGDTTAHMVNA